MSGSTRLQLIFFRLGRIDNSSSEGRRPAALSLPTSFSLGRSF